MQILQTILLPGKYLLSGQVSIDIIFSLRYGSSFGKNCICSNTILIKSSEGV